MRTMGGVVVALVLVVVLGAAVLGLPATTDDAVAAPVEVPDAPVRPPLQQHVVDARDAVAAGRAERAAQAAAEVEAARVEAQTRWDAGDVPITPARLVLLVAAVAVMLLVALRREQA